MGKAKRAAGVRVGKVPKLKCCESKPRCSRCPIRMLKDGTLPTGYTVKRRVLVRLDGGKVSKKKVARRVARDAATASVASASDRSGRSKKSGRMVA